MKDLLFPSFALKDDTRGVGAAAKGIGLFRWLDVTVTIWGVRCALSVGDGGNTKSVWDWEGVVTDSCDS